jgi:hypothetical protein
MKNELVILFFGLLLVLFLTTTSYKPEISKTEEFGFYQKIIRAVLEESKVGEIYHIVNANSIVIEEYEVYYVGSIKSKNKEVYHFVNGVLFFGNYEDSKRANPSLFVFDDQQNFLGRYYYGSYSSGIFTILDDKLCFPIETDCDAVNNISFKEGVPNEIFVLCSGSSGNIYKLSQSF